MTDPFGTKIRRYIPWTKYRDLVKAQTKITLTDRLEISLAEVEARLRVLRQHELEHGFVYVGEKKWLEDYLYSSERTHYSAWAANQLRSFVFPGGLIAGDNSWSGKHWFAETENLSIFWSPPELSVSPPEFFQDVSVSLIGPGATAADPQLRQLFDILHDFPYYFHTARIQWTYYVEHDALNPAAFHELVVPFPGCQWHMGWISNYGGNGATYFDKRTGDNRRTMIFNPSWRTPTIASLAQTVFDERDPLSGVFDNHRMGVLADALEEVGCDKVALLEHLRGGGEHECGCWAVDFAAGKEWMR